MKKFGPFLTKLPVGWLWNHRSTCTPLKTAILEKYDWTRLNHIQLGRYAEYFAKMEFTLYGFDVYTAEVDDKGIDFVIRREGRYFDVQVKSVRGNNYIFFRKDKFEPRENLLAVIVLFNPAERPGIYLVPSLVWEEGNSLFSSRNYIGKKSKPEWGLNISRKNLKRLEYYRFDLMIENI